MSNLFEVIGVPGSVDAATYIGNANTSSNTNTLARQVANIDALLTTAGGKILGDTGIQLERNKADMAELAQTDYRAYNQKKKQFRDLITAEVLRAYGLVYQEFLKLGYPEEVCKQKGLENSLKTKEVLSEAFKALFPNIGAPVQDVY